MLRRADSVVEGEFKGQPLQFTLDSGASSTALYPHFYDRFHDLDYKDDETQFGRRRHRDVACEAPA